MTTGTQRLGARLAELLDADHWVEVEPQLSKLLQFEKACVGLPDGALDGNWTAAGLSAYAKGLEDSLSALRADLAAAKAERAAFGKVMGDEIDLQKQFCVEWQRKLSLVTAQLSDIRHACPQYQTGEWKARFAAIDAAIAGSKG